LENIIVNTTYIQILGERTIKRTVNKIIRCDTMTDRHNTTVKMTKT